MAVVATLRKTTIVLVLLTLFGLVLYFDFCLSTSSSTPVLKNQNNLAAKFLNRQFEYVLDAPEAGFCDQITVLALVITAPGNFEKREDARRTWVYDKENPANIRVRFLIGRTTNASVEAKIAEERREYKDILRYSYLDAYDLLPVKVHVAFHFFQTFCPNAKYFLKIDDDVVADLGRLSYHINKSFDQRRRRDFFACYVWRRPDVKRKTSDPFYISPAEYPNKHYPNVCSGPAYLMTREAVTKILQSIPSLRFFKFEDVMFSGMAREKSNIQLISSMMVDGNSATHPIKQVFCDSDGVPLPATMRFVERVKNVSAAYEAFKRLTCHRGIRRPNGWIST